jgi:prepilin-type processing-associated H-X9-DG protein
MGWYAILNQDHLKQKISVLCPEADSEDRPFHPFKAYYANLNWDPHLASLTGSLFSIGFNRWACDSDGWEQEKYWKKFETRTSGSRIPLFADVAMEDEFWINDTPEAPNLFETWVKENGSEYNNQYSGEVGKWRALSMHRIWLNRHNGGTNMAFLDLSVRFVGLGEMYTLKYSKAFNTNNSWANADRSQWPQWAQKYIND